MLEIERKFLVKDLMLIKPYLKNGIDFRQGYLFYDDHKSLRVRISSNIATITIKIGDNPLVREEIEYEITIAEAEVLWNHCSKKLTKTRYLLTENGANWEVDLFHGQHKGLILAEIELKTPEDSFVAPSWLGIEVTSDPRYLNVNLADS